MIYSLNKEYEEENVYNPTPTELFNFIFLHLTQTAKYEILKVFSSEWVFNFSPFHIFCSWFQWGDTKKVRKA